MPLVYSWKSAAGKDNLGLLANNPFNFIMFLFFLQFDLYPFQGLLQWLCQITDLDKTKRMVEYTFPLCCLSWLMV